MKRSGGIFSFMAAFPTEESCIEYLEKIRWNGHVVSPFDETSKVYKCRNHKYRCKNTSKYFDVKTGTVFANTKLPLQYWLYAMSLFVSHKRGVSSCQLARDLGITQKTAWKMLHKIREFMECENNHELSGTVEIDETFVGGKNKNRHKDKKVKKCQGRSFKDKVPVFGILERGGKVIAKVVPNTQSKTLVPIVMKYVKKGSLVNTDGWEYTGLNGDYVQKSVDHEKYFYGYTDITADGELTTVSTNGMENVWSHFKRMILGTYYHVSKKHMQRYVDEYIFRFNTRDNSDSQRFDLLLQTISA